MKVYLVLALVAALALASQRHERQALNKKMMMPKMPFQRRSALDTAAECQTFLANNLLLAGQLNGGETPAGTFFFGRVYTAAVPTILADAQLHLDFKLKCRVGQNCNLTSTFDENQNPSYSSFIGVHAYLIRVRQNASPPNPGDFASIVTDSSANPQIPGGSPNQNIDFTVQSGPVYDRMDDLVYMQTFNVDNRVPRHYQLDYCVAGDPRWRDEGIRMNVGDNLWVVFQVGSTQTSISSNGGLNFNGHFNWEVKFPVDK